MKAPHAAGRVKLPISQRAFIVYRNYFTHSFGLAWAGDSEKASETIYKAPPNSTDKNNIYQSCVELRGNCYYFGDCGPTGNDWRATFGTIILDMENSFWIKPELEQEHANLHTYLMKTLQEEAISPQTELGSADLFAHNSFGYSRAIDIRLRQICSLRYRLSKPPPVVSAVCPMQLLASLLPITPIF